MIYALMRTMGYFHQVYVRLFYPYIFLIQSSLCNWSVVAQKSKLTFPTVATVNWWLGLNMSLPIDANELDTVYPKKYAHGFVVLCFVVVMQSFIMNSHEVFIHIHHGCFAGTGAIVRLPQCQWSKPDGYGKISQCITTTKHSKAKTVCICLGIYCIYRGSYHLTSVIELRTP